MNDQINAHIANLGRRQFIRNSSSALGAAALSSLWTPNAAAAGPQFPNFAPKAKRVIWLFMAGGPSHMDTFDYHDKLKDYHGQELPDSIRNGQRITGMTSGQSSFPVVQSPFKFDRYGKNGTYVSELLPYTSKIVDDITIIKSMNTEAVNHDPAITFINTGDQVPGKPSMGAWLSYGLGSSNENMPSYVVMISRGRGNLQALYSRLWGSGFLPGKHQGVKLRSSGDPVLYLANPNGISRSDRRKVLDGLAKLNENHHDQFGDPETQARIAQYEMAFRMQTEAPDLTDISSEPKSTFDLYGEEAKKPGTFAANCLRARRMAESGVRFIQLFHRGWDQHNNLEKNIKMQCEDIDRGSAALVTDLKNRGMLEDTLVIWGGEFGRTIYQQGKIGDPKAGRDHHGRAFTIWAAGGGLKGGFEYGKTDDYCYNITENPVHIRDFNATVLNQLGIDHNRLTFKYQGLDQKLTGVEHAHVVKDIIA